MPEPLTFLLKPFALLFRSTVQVRNTLFERKIIRKWKSPIPVVSIGNISAGGTGKTPLVDWVVKYYLSIGCKPAIVSRGYRRETKGVQLVSDGQRVLLSSSQSGDETAMLAWNNPDSIVVVSEKRKDAVTFITRYFAKRLPCVIILDDAFQHRQIARDLDIALVNASEPVLKARMIPEGRMREPMKNIARADLILLNKIGEGDEEKTGLILKKLEKTGRPIVKGRIRTREIVCVSGDFMPSEIPSHKELRVLAFAGIAFPESFLESLRKEGMHVESHHFFRDHEPYSQKRLQSLRSEATGKGLSLITTEKDYFRMLGRPELLSIITALPCYYLKIETDIFEGKEKLQEMLRTVVGRK
ncbi:MAG: tetraacyldisaccharide 4'-kinase [Chlorobiaceae bacterium]|nr:tetraacyldisaccharide 4'-kinase [Chlorobiaceae bacterium]NTV61035.1 tetraacyldisaccharide 4'-kinase [Chlorobiaceae bacterium]